MIRVVAGPPCAGKTTFVAERRSVGELVVDLDTIKDALGGPHPNVTPVARAARQAVISELARDPEVDAWVIGGYSLKAQRSNLRESLGASVIVLATPEDVCFSRLADRPPEVQAELARAISRWWATYEPDERDEVVR